jgi:hypothetical protein
MRRVLEFIRQLREDVGPADERNEYGIGYLNALSEVEEYIDYELWQEGDDGEESSTA